MKAYRGISEMVGVVMAAAVLALAGCATTGGSNPSGPQLMVDEARAKWSNAALDNYSYRFERSCFCPEDWRRAVIVIVRGDTVVDALFADTRSPVPRENLSRYQTIDGLFGMLQEAVDRNAHSMTVSYHPDYGYPTSASIDYDAAMADEEAYFTADSLQAGR